MTMTIRYGLFLLAGILLWIPSAWAEVQTRDVSYRDGDVELQGMLAWDSALQGARPGVLIIHEWWGLNDHARHRARELAKLGYAAFALDMYGGGQSTTDARQAGAWAGALYRDLPHMRQRAAAGLAAMQTQPEVDGANVAALGYCFGGTVALQLAYSGADLKAAVSFHGNPLPPGDDDLKRTKATLMVCHGQADPNVKQDTIDAFRNALASSTVDWLWIDYGHAVHSFTNPAADGTRSPGVKYHPIADRRSWQHLRALLQETLGK